MQDMRLRLLMVTPRYLPYTGGVESHVDQVSRRLARAGIDVTILTTDPDHNLPPVQHYDPGVTVQRVPAWPRGRDYYFAPDIYRVITEGHWDVVHVQSYHTLVAPLAMLAAWRARIPYVVTFHGGGHSSRLRNAARPIQRALLRPLLAHADRLVAVAEFEIGLYSRELGISPDRFTLIPNGSDLPPATSPANGHEREHGLIVSVGRLERYKGHHLIIAALPRILSVEPDARLLVLGTGPYRETLLRLARASGVEDRVEIRAIPPSDRQAMSDQLSRASLFVLLSEQETHPIAVLEALSMGCQALVADSQGLSELADRGLVRSISLDSTLDELAAAVVDQLQHPLPPRHVAIPSWDDCAAGLRTLYTGITRSITENDTEVSRA